MNGMVLPPGQKPQAGVALSQDAVTDCMLVNGHDLPCSVPLNKFSLSKGNLFAGWAQWWRRCEMNLLAGSIARYHCRCPLDFHENWSL